MHVIKLSNKFYAILTNPYIECGNFNKFEINFNGSKWKAAKSLLSII